MPSVTEILKSSTIGDVTSLTVKTSNSAQSKAGKVHEFSVYIESLSGGATGDGVIVTGDLPVIINSRVASYTGEGIIVQIKESPTYTGGAFLPTYNKSRINDSAPQFVVMSGVDIADAGSDVFADEYLIGNDSNAGSGQTGVGLGYDRVLKPNTTYLLRLQSLDNQPQSVFVFNSFYEGEL